ncbi:DUF7115 domain-containing protein [Natronorubrum sulfidifaciens]|uniref:DUF7115 domain-containing protein n=1 Tax=Natronorubrum sulfidifaciens JCM 14089 TaxID=1230460 RepID=L9VXZ5_9EURY|nr:hypothetical protein [Natronorubrum sulfidifaciens]ELY42050.1 hypothetical protein C495_15908 [Natronorubrum sulfidifaciens JCM 14089]
MSVPGIVHSTLDGEEIAARVSLGGDDELFITPSSTLVYNSEGLLSDESVDEYPHDADRLTLSEGRRKTAFSLEYPLEGTKKFTVPASKTDAVLHPVLAGVLNGNGITEPGETVVQTYRFSELTLIITSDRLVKHIGAAVWDGDYEEYEFADVTGLSFEDGSVATQIVLAVDGRPQRIKAPNEEANDLRERLKRALFEYHDVGSLAALNELVGDDADSDQERNRASVDFGDGVDPLDANPPELNDDSGDAVDETTDPTSVESTDPLAESSTAASTAEQPAHAHDASDGRAEYGQQNSSQTQPTGESAQAETTEPNTETTATTFEMPADESTDSATEHVDAPASTEPDRDRDAHDSVLESGSLLGGEIDDTATDTDDTTAAAEQVANSDLLERLESLESTVEQQTETIERQQQTIEQLIAELRARR